MPKRGKRNLVLTLLLVVVMGVFLAGNVAAVRANFTIQNNPSKLYNLGANNTFNFSVGAMSENITKLEIIFMTASVFGQGEQFNLESNLTDASNVIFTNYTEGSGTIYLNLTFSNATAAGIIPNGSTRSFSIDVSARRVTSLVQIKLRASGTSGSTQNETDFENYYPAFTFNGYIRNETGCATCWQNGTNVTIYGIINNMNGPPTQIALANTLTNDTGYFRLSLVNASTSFMGYRLKTIFYNSTGTATKTGSILPDFPAQMFYGLGEGEFDMSLNGGTFYLQPAATLFLKAHNNSNQVNFGYEVIDQALGFPIESNVQEKVYNVTVVVPSGRGYAVSFVRMFSMLGSTSGYAFAPSCGDFMNASTCPIPPRTTSVSASSLTQGSVVTINQSMILRKISVGGCINPAVGANNSAVNITAVNVKMIPWVLPEGNFIPPTRGDDGQINISNPAMFNTTYSPNCLAYYNLTLLNNTNYIIEIYAKNTSLGNGAGEPGSANNLAGFANFSVSEDKQFNVSLYKLIGNYYNSSVAGISVNTSLLKINIINSTGGAITTQINANLKVKNSASGVGTLYYIIDNQNINNGTFYVPILNNSNFAKIMVFSQNGPPKEMSINLSASEVNITIVSMNQDKGFRKFRSNGTLETVDTSSTPIQMRFLRTDSECDVPNAPSTCVITEMNASGFNPMKAMLAGKVNMEIKISSTNVSIIFHDYDMMSAKQPPMNSIMDQNASSRKNTAGAVQDVWNFGSFAPADSYENVTIVLPYSDSVSVSNYLNESRQVNVSIPVLYDENQNVVWNKTRGDSSANFTDDFIDFNNTFYQGLINSTNGVICDSSDINSVAFLNTSANYIALKVPHFSTLGAGISGSATTTPDQDPDPDSDEEGGGGTGGTTASFWNFTFPDSDKELKIKGKVTRLLDRAERVRIKVNGTLHYVGLISLTTSKATINVSSTPQQAVFDIGEVIDFSVDNDTIDDVRVTLKDIENDQAEVTIEYISQDASSNSDDPILNSALNNVANLNSTNNTSGTNSSELDGASKGSLSTSLKWTVILTLIIVLVGVSIYFYVTQMRKMPPNFEKRVKVKSP